MMKFTTLIDVAALREMLADPGVVVLDCRFDLLNPQAGRDAYLAGHIPGSRYADLNKDLSVPVTSTSGRHPLPTPQDFAATLARLGIGNDTQVIAYDQSNGSFAARLWWMLRWLGHQAVAVLDGGFSAWTGAGEPVETLAPGQCPSEPAAAARFYPQVKAAALLTTAEVAQLLREPGKLLVDARARERYLGSVEPIDSVAGHIAGAVNHPFSQNLDQNGRFLPASELRRRWLERLGGIEPSNVAAMCGSGVTACHNLLALEIAGLSGAKLYGGSWSEWIKDPGRLQSLGS
jgi:thiosulfate/3-mercaptopyruvate sulfurtransferase